MSNLRTGPDEDERSGRHCGVYAPQAGGLTLDLPLMPMAEVFRAPQASGNRQRCYDGCEDVADHAAACSGR